MATKATTGIFLALLAAAWCVPCAAQGTVYESKDKSGPVFSDQPSPGAKPVDLAPPNVIQTPKAPASRPSPTGPAPAASAKPAANYSSLAITTPADEDTVHTNTGEFDIVVQSVPALRAKAGDRYRVTLDGNLLAKPYQSRTIRISEADWQAAAGTDAKHTLQVAIVGPAGATLMQSAPISFYAHRATVRRSRR